MIVWPNIFFRPTEEFVKLSTRVTVFWSQANQNLTLSSMDLALDYHVSSLALSFLQNATKQTRAHIPELATGSRWFTEMLASLGTPEMLDFSTVY